MLSWRRGTRGFVVCGGRGAAGTGATGVDGHASHGAARRRSRTTPTFQKSNQISRSDRTTPAAPIQHRVVPVALSADLRPVAARGGDLTQIVTHRSGPARGQNLASARPARRAARAACGRARVATIGTFRLTLPLRTVAVTESETRYRIPGPLERRGSTRTERTSKVHTYFSDRRHVNCAESGRPTVLSTPK